MIIIVMIVSNNNDNDNSQVQALFHLSLSNEQWEKWYHYIWYNDEETGTSERSSHLIEVTQQGSGRTRLWPRSVWLNPWSSPAPDLGRDICRSEERCPLVPMWTWSYHMGASPRIFPVSVSSRSKAVPAKAKTLPSWCVFTTFPESESYAVAELKSTGGKEIIRGGASPSRIQLRSH